jgi:hypothetical protein
MEDYVCTFLQQYAESAGFEERIAFLVGKQMLIDGQQYLFVGGAIYGRYAEKHEGHLRFTEKSVDYAEEMLEEFFPNMEIIGWAQSQPSYGTYLNQYYGAYHLRQFRKAHQVMFVIDPLERTNAFYAANPTAMTPADRMEEISGYFIYYEKNTNMHEYMLVNKSSDYTTKSPTLVELKPLEFATEDEPQDYENLFEDEPKMEGRFSMGGPKLRGEPEDVIRRHEAAKSRRRGSFLEQKRMMNLLAGLCAVLFVISFVMGVGLIRNQERLDNYGAQMRQLATALRDHMADATEPVFAEGISVPELPNAVENIPEVTETPAPTPQPTATPPQSDTTAAINPPALGEVDALISPIPASYTIQPGDSLLAISLYFFGDTNMVNEILALNGIENADHIIAGRTIALPQR